MTMRVLSFGGGVQSTALLVLAAQGKINFRTFLFANVGDDSEHPATLAYVRDVAIPYAAAHGLVMEELHRTYRSNKRASFTLYESIVDDRRTVDIPMRVANGTPGNRTCTKLFKIFVVDRWLTERGATPAAPATVGLGISIDEYQRMRSDDPRYPFRQWEYPLIDLRLTRHDCQAIIRDAGLPVPPKSSCWFCPFHRTRDWHNLQRDYPDLFAKAVALEQRVNEKRATLGRDPLYMTWNSIPLEVLGSAQQHELDLDDACESGYCMT